MMTKYPILSSFFDFLEYHETGQQYLSARLLVPKGRLPKISEITIEKGERIVGQEKDGTFREV